MATRRTPRRMTGGRRAPTNWARSDFPTTGTFLSIAQGTKVLLGTVVLSNPGINETIRRTRGIISWASDQGAAIEDQIGAFGMIVVNDLALAAGAASIPGPITDGSDDGWFVWVPLSSRGSAAASGLIVSVEEQFDSKAMRKVEEGFGVAVMVENASGTAGENFLFNTVLSILTSQT